MSSKSKGIRKEWALKQYLEKQGFLVLRSSASKTGIDLLAGDGKEVMAIQVQSSPYIYPEKLQELIKYADAIKAKPMIVLRKRKVSANNRSAVPWIFIRPDQLKKTGKMFKIEDA